MKKTIITLLKSATIFLAAFTVQAQAEEPIVKVYSKFVPEREDDFAWENDKVAFRMYGPSSRSAGPVSGVDCWLKRVDYSIIDKWYEAHTKGISYHTDWGEGYDPYHVGATRGCGGTAIWIDGKAFPAGAFTAWRIIENEGKKTSFELDYAWQTSLGLIQETKLISLKMGSQLYQVESRFLLNGKAAKNLSIAIGLSTHDGAAKVYKDLDKGLIATWEKFSEHYLGTGALIEPALVDDIIEQKAEEKDKSHLWLISHTNEQGKFEYSAGYGWQRAGEFKTPENWYTYLSNFNKKEQK